MSKLTSKIAEKKKILEYSVLCALFIKEIRKLDDEKLNQWFMVMNKTDGLSDEFMLMLRDMIKKCLFDEHEKRSKSVK